MSTKQLLSSSLNVSDKLTCIIEIEAGHIIH